MPRLARQLSNSGVYHIIIRGINQQIIFEDEEDNTRLLETIKAYMEKSGYKIFAYCLMGNHFHILIKTEKDDLDIIIKRIAGSYVYWYNWKYNRRGHLFQDRFKSEPVENDEYLLTVLRYIHQNPMKAGLCTKLEDYKYSSYSDYIDGKSEIVDTSFVLSIVSKQEFTDYHKNPITQEVMGIDSCITRLKDSEATAVILDVAKCNHSSEVQTLESEHRSKIIKALKARGLSVRQISRLTGVSKGMVERNR